MVPELNTVEGWYRTLDAGGTLFSTSLKLGRPRDPSIAVTIRALLEEHPYASTKMIAAALGKTKETIKNRLLLDMGYKKYASKWVPHKLTNSQKAQRVEHATSLLALLKKVEPKHFLDLCTGDEGWVSFYNRPNAQWLPYGSERPTFPKTTLATPKLLITLFINGSQVWTPSYIPAGDTMKTESFINSVLTPLRAEMNEMPYYSGKGIYLHCDNASCHRSKETRKAYEDYGFYEVLHPPYSPDLSPLDFFLFGDMKEHLKGAIFPSDKALVARIDEYLRSVDANLLHRVFAHWMFRCEVVILTDGEYYKFPKI
jgi:histone-lysine N-methyltransferase SETMAR